MAKSQKPFLYCCLILLLLSIFSSTSFFFWSQCSRCCSSQPQMRNQQDNQTINLLQFQSARNHLPVSSQPPQMRNQQANQTINLLNFQSAWNHLHFSSQPPQKLLKIALFVKKWPQKDHSGGLERHAMTLHLALARRGHEIHIFTGLPPDSTSVTYPMSNLVFHFSKPTASGYLDQAGVWKQFEEQNLSGRPFDVIHTESAALMHTRARNHTNLVVSWHGIAYESIHSGIIQELLMSSEEPQPKLLTTMVKKVVEEVRFFRSYAHHVATSDYAGDILKRIYMIPEERVHIILNGVNEDLFKPNAAKGTEMRSKFGIPESKPLLIGMAGRLVKDKGHPIMFEALKQIFKENSTFRDGVMVLVAGDGPWQTRYKDLGPNVRVLGPLEQKELATFYNMIDIYVNPTLRSQGLDHTLLEAILTAKPLMSTKLASITETVIVSKDIGYTFSPTVASLKKALYEVWGDGRKILEEKGLMARERGLKLFTASKMAAAYEKLFLCLAFRGDGTDASCMYSTENK